MFSALAQAVLLAVLKTLTAMYERWRELMDKKDQGRTEARAEISQKTAGTEHEMAKVDATPSDNDAVSDSLRSGKF